MALYVFVHHDAWSCWDLISLSISHISLLLADRVFQALQHTPCLPLPPKPSRLLLLSCSPSPSTMGFLWVFFKPVILLLLLFTSPLILTWLTSSLFSSVCWNVTSRKRPQMILYQIGLRSPPLLTLHSIVILSSYKRVPGIFCPLFIFSFFPLK